MTRKEKEEVALRLVCYRAGYRAGYHAAKSETRGIGMGLKNAGKPAFNLDRDNHPDPSDG